MGICCSKAAAGELDDDEGLGFPWMHDDVFHSHLWASAGVSVHTKQGWKGANQDAMTVSQVHHRTLPLSLSLLCLHLGLVAELVRLCLLVRPSHLVAPCTADIVQPARMIAIKKPEISLDNMMISLPYT